MHRVIAVFILCVLIACSSGCSNKVKQKPTGDLSPKSEKFVVCDDCDCAVYRRYNPGECK